MHESAFEIDDNIAIYDGYTDGTHWNGWACPWFTKETCRLNSGIVSVTQLKTHILIGHEFIPQYMTFLHVCKNTMSEALMIL